MRIIIYAVALIGSIVLLVLPFTRRASILNRSEKSAFLMAGAFGVTWVILGYVLASSFVKSRDALIILGIVKTLACGLVSGIVLTLNLCGYFRQKPRL
jgi:hypothetical protein